jgi:multidrug efflux pump subunit AcrA (membrane-fusion protein)
MKTLIRRVIIGAIFLLAALAVAVTLVAQPSAPPRASVLHPEDAVGLPVTVVRVGPMQFVDTVLATGSLVQREEILVGPEVEGLRITEVLADEGMRVKKGDVLARLVAATLLDGGT